MKTKYYIPDVEEFVEIKYGVDTNGKINVNISLSEISNNLPMMPKFGTNLMINENYNNVKWYGRGPHENYQDRNTSSLVRCL